MIRAHLNPVMFHAPMHQAPRQASDMSSLLDALANASSRPRYAFMVLNLIAEVARPDGSAGPFIKRQGASISLRDWLFSSTSTSPFAIAATACWASGPMQSLANPR